MRMTFDTASRHSFESQLADDDDDLYLRLRLVDVKGQPPILTSMALNILSCCPRADLISFDVCFMHAQTTIRVAFRHRSNHPAIQPSSHPFHLFHPTIQPSNHPLAISIHWHTHRDTERHPPYLANWSPWLLLPEKPQLCRSYSDNLWIMNPWHFFATSWRPH